jgi:hypothetical protein
MLAASKGVATRHETRFGGFFVARRSVVVSPAGQPVSGVERGRAVAGHAGGARFTAGGRNRRDAAAGRARARGCKNFCVNGQLAGNCCTSMELHLNDRHERIDR